jgi:acetamidase/formamidase
VPPISPRGRSPNQSTVERCDANLGIAVACGCRCNNATDEVEEMGNGSSVRIAATPETVKWGFFDASTPAIAHVPSGTELTIETVSGGPQYLPTDPALEILPEHKAIQAGAERGHGPHFLTGPIHVEGAKPGNVLVVDIIDVGLRQNWGFNLIIPLQGTIPDDFPDFVLRHLPIDKAMKTVTLPWGGSLPLNPFFGVMGVAPRRRTGAVSAR